jgi:hypothetical protein
MVMGIGADVEPPALSLTWTLSVKVPETAGIPPMIPLAGDKLSPTGSELPNTDQV